MTCDAARRYTQMQEKTKAKYRERVERQFKIVKPDATAAELKEVAEGDFQDIFAKHLMTNQHKAAQQAIADINDKHQVHAGAASAAACFWRAPMPARRTL